MSLSPLPTRICTVRIFALGLFALGFFFGVSSWLLAPAARSPNAYYPPLGRLIVFVFEGPGTASGNSSRSSSDSFRVDTAFRFWCSADITIMKNRSPRSFGGLCFLNCLVLWRITGFGFLLELLVFGSGQRSGIELLVFRCRWCCLPLLFCLSWKKALMHLHIGQTMLPSLAIFCVFCRWQHYWTIHCILSNTRFPIHGTIFFQTRDILFDLWYFVFRFQVPNSPIEFLGS